jgi:hypothetical protein
VRKIEMALHDICGKDGDYGARVLRTEVMREHAGEKVAKLVRAFVPKGFEIRIERDKLVCDANRIVGGNEVWPYVVTLQDARIGTDEHEQATDAHIFVRGKTLPGALANLLAVILDGGGFFPLT